MLRDGVLPEHHPVDVQVVIPAFNEELRIGSTLTELVAYLEDQPWTSAVVVVDNGSSDATAEAVDRVRSGAIPIAVVGCASQGKGAAVRRGILLGQPRLVGFCDADGSTPFTAIHGAVELLQEGADLVVGSRRIEGAAYLTTQPIKRRVAGALFRHLVRPIVPSITDTQCGFKFFRRAAAVEIFTRSQIDGFAFDVEVLALARHLGLRIAELPVEWSDVEGSTLTLRAHGKPLLRDIRQLRTTFAGGARAASTPE
jgi:dolichyl-phosphate beta-glucosyltransferase